eukprot:11480-Pelagococcus_subviridis.AAC.2
MKRTTRAIGQSSSLKPVGSERGRGGAANANDERKKTIEKLKSKRKRVLGARTAERPRRRPHAVHGRRARAILQRRQHDRRHDRPIAAVHAPPRRAHVDERHGPDPRGPLPARHRDEVVFASVHPRGDHLLQVDAVRDRARDRGHVRAVHVHARHRVL